jgi:nucleolar complex protein 3
VEKTAKVSKEVQQLRTFEQSLLTNYKAYISSLTSTIKSARTKDSFAPLAVVAVTCVTNLLTAVPHFNFRSDLLKIVVAQVSRRTADEMFGKCRNAIQKVFEEDEDGNASLETVSVLCKMIKSRDYKVHPSVTSHYCRLTQIIQTFLYLRLLSELGIKASTTSSDLPKAKKKDRSFRTKKQRKLMKEHKKVEKDLAEADAQVSVEERSRLQSETLKLLFGLYFRTLKSSPSDALLSVVLDGIGTFGRLINAEFFGDLLEVLREILQDWEGGLREELVCVSTAFMLLANQSGTKIDLTFFIDRFYELLLEASLCTTLLDKPSAEERSLMELIVKIVDAILFTPPTAPPPVRILLFYKRLLVCSLQVDEKPAMVFMKLLQRISNRFEKKVEGIWDKEGAGLGDAGTGRGVRGWELSLLRKYYATNIREMSSNLPKTGDTRS